MPLTNQQYNAIIRQYDLIRIKNKHIHDDRLEDVRTKAPEYDELDKKISELSVEVSKQILTPGITEEKKKEIKKELDENLRDIENAKKEILIRLYNDPHYLDPIYTCSKCNTAVVNPLFNDLFLCRLLLEVYIYRCCMSVKNRYSDTLCCNYRLCSCK